MSHKWASAAQLFKTTKVTLLQEQKVTCLKSEIYPIIFIFCTE